jgi:hypothetical protein
MKSVLAWFALLITVSAVFAWSCLMFVSLD